MAIKNLELRARIVVEGFWHGIHRSPYHGFSVEFTEYRQYSPGDDPRYLDWRLFARSDRYYIKKFEDETNLRCYLLVDHSRSMDYGSLGYTKSQYANTLAATLAYFLHHQGDARVADKSPSLLTVARINKVENFKGHDVVLRALPRLLERYPDLVYDVVGDGDARPELEQLARSLGVADAVRFRGIVSDKQLSTIYADASVMVMPSAREGFGFVFLEAMAHGTPAIGGNIDAAPEVISDGETGFVVDPYSVDAVAAAIDRVLGDHGLRERMSRAAVARAHAHFGFERFRTQLIDQLAEVVAP